MTRFSKGPFQGLHRTATIEHWAKRRRKAPGTRFSPKRSRTCRQNEEKKRKRKEPDAALPSRSTFLPIVCKRSLPSPVSWRPPIISLRANQSPCRPSTTTSSVCPKMVGSLEATWGLSLLRLHGYGPFRGGACQGRRGSGGGHARGRYVGGLQVGAL